MKDSSIRLKAHAKMKSFQAQGWRLVTFNSGRYFMVRHYKVMTIEIISTNEGRVWIDGNIKERFF